MRFIRLILLFLFVVSAFPASAQAQTATPPAAVQLMLDSMTPEELIGQLFLVTFTGTDVSPESQIYKLITDYHLGGVMLLASNDNFSATDTLSKTRALIDSLQTMEWSATVNYANDSGQPDRPVYVPLFVGIAQEGDGYPTDEILNGLTPLPSEMAIGATWNTETAKAVGEVRGEELSMLGFNLILGPSLDVLEAPSSLGGDLSTRVFGGDPFWVGEMGRAYVEGLHLGSEEQLLVIAKHFPGVGGADRLPEDEVSTVRKSLEQLKQIELAPFFAVTGNATSPQASVDGLLVSHIRYQGFQGNIRATTRPISFDSQALNQILALPQFSAWYADGGLLISDNIGTNAVREFYATGGGQFSARIAARDAFLAGNDIIYLGNIKSDDSPDNFTTVIRILEFFTQKYREDPAFAQRVDASVARILEAKLNLYNNFTLSNVTVPGSNDLSEIGDATGVTFTVARNSATLVTPALSDLTSILPLPPQPSDRLVFVTDSLNVRQCSECLPQPTLAVDAFESAVLQLYGPTSGNQVEDFRLASYSLTNLQELLDAPDDNQFVADDLDFADWIILSVTDNSRGQTALISRFLRERPELALNKNIIVFSFGAPYYFDTTTLSKFTAYYVLYSKQPQFVDAAVRLLFQEVRPTGASPVSIPAVGYDLISVMSPDPDQIIPLILDLPPVLIDPESNLTPEPTPIPLFQIGDTIAIRTGVIRDRNGHSVPDGTVVQFSMVLTGEGAGILQQVEATTTQGVARASFGLDKPGLLEIHVSSEPAVISEVVQLDVSQSGAVAVTVVVPELTQSVEPTPIPTPVVVEDTYITLQGYPRFSAWFLSMLVILFGSGVTYGIASQFVRRPSALRWSLGILLGGLVAYNLLAFGVFGVSTWLTGSGLSGVILFTLAGQAFGFMGGWLWSRTEK